MDDSMDDLTSMLDDVGDIPRWCDRCNELKQELSNVREEQAVNYSSLKEKIISTDLLITKYKKKCDDYDTQATALKEVTERLNKKQVECRMMGIQVKSAMDEITPLKTIIEKYEQQHASQLAEAEALKNELHSVQMIKSQLEVLSRSSSAESDQSKTERRDMAKKQTALEARIRSQDISITKLKETMNEKKAELYTCRRENQQLTKDITNIKAKLEEFKAILLRHNLLPTGEQGVEASSSKKVDEDEETTKTIQSMNMIDSDDVDNMSDSSMDSVSPSDILRDFLIVHTLSPLPSTPVPCYVDEDSHSEWAGLEEDGIENDDKKNINNVKSDKIIVAEKKDDTELYINHDYLIRDDCDIDGTNADVLDSSHEDIVDDSHADIVDGSHADNVDSSHADIVDGSHADNVDSSHADIVDGSHADIVDGSHADIVDSSHADIVDGSHADIETISDESYDKPFKESDVGSAILDVAEKAIVSNTNIKEELSPECTTLTSINTCEAVSRVKDKIVQDKVPSPSESICETRLILDRENIGESEENSQQVVVIEGNSSTKDTEQSFSEIFNEVTTDLVKSECDGNTRTLFSASNCTFFDTLTDSVENTSISSISAACMKDHLTSPNANGNDSVAMSDILLDIPSGEAAPKSQNYSNDASKYGCSTKESIVRSSNDLFNPNDDTNVSVSSTLVSDKPLLSWGDNTSNYDLSLVNSTDQQFGPTNHIEKSESSSYHEQSCIFNNIGQVNLVNSEIHSTSISDTKNNCKNHDDSSKLYKISKCDGLVITSSDEQSKKQSDSINTSQYGMSDTEQGSDTEQRYDKMLVSKSVSVSPRLTRSKSRMTTFSDTGTADKSMCTRPKRKCTQRTRSATELTPTKQSALMSDFHFDDGEISFNVSVEIESRNGSNHEADNKVTVGDETNVTSSETALCADDTLVSDGKLVLVCNSKDNGVVTVPDTKPPETSLLAVSDKKAASLASEDDKAVQTHLLLDSKTFVNNVSYLTDNVPEIANKKYDTVDSKLLQTVNDMVPHDEIIKAADEKNNDHAHSDIVTENKIKATNCEVIIRSLKADAPVAQVGSMMNNITGHMMDIQSNINESALNDKTSTSTLCAVDQSLVANCSPNNEALNTVATELGSSSDILVDLSDSDEEIQDSPRVVLDAVSNNLSQIPQISGTNLEATAISENIIAKNIQKGVMLTAGDNLKQELNSITNEIHPLSGRHHELQNQQIIKNSGSLLDNITPVDLDEPDENDAEVELIASWKSRKLVNRINDTPGSDQCLTPRVTTCPTSSSGQSMSLCSPIAVSPFLMHSSPPLSPLPPTPPCYPKFAIQEGKETADNTAGYQVLNPSPLHMKKFSAISMLTDCNLIRPTATKSKEYTIEEKLIYPKCEMPFRSSEQIVDPDVVSVTKRTKKADQQFTRQKGSGPLENVAYDQYASLNNSNMLSRKSTLTNSESIAVLSGSEIDDKLKSEFSLDSRDQTVIESEVKMNIYKKPTRQHEREAKKLSRDSGELSTSKGALMKRKSVVDESARTPSPISAKRAKGENVTVNSDPVNQQVTNFLNELMKSSHEVTYQQLDRLLSGREHSAIIACLVQQIVTMLLNKHEMLWETLVQKSPGQTNPVVVTQEEECFIKLTAALSASHSHLGMSQKLCEAVWTSVMTITDHSLPHSSLVRLLTGVCRLTGDYGQIRTLIYILSKQHIATLYHLICVASVWPDVLAKPPSACCLILDALQYCVNAELPRIAKGKDRSMIEACLSARCNMDTRHGMKHKDLSERILKHVKSVMLMPDSSHKHDMLFDVVKATELILSYMPSRKATELLTKQFVPYIKDLSSQGEMTGSVMSFIKHTFDFITDRVMQNSGEELRVSARETISSLHNTFCAVKTAKSIPLSVQQLAIDAILTLSHIYPRMCVLNVYAWFQKHRAAPPELLARFTKFIHKNRNITNTFKKIFNELNQLEC